jgi:hypothetical protein
MNKSSLEMFINCTYDKDIARLDAIHKEYGTQLGKVRKE